MTTSQTHVRYAEFSNPRLVAIYDAINPIDTYRDFYLDLAAELSPATILDIGCGTGLLTSELARRGYHMIGLEPSAGLLELARRPGCEDVVWIEGTVERLGELNADLALMTGHVVQFFLEDEAWRDALRRIHDAVHPGGHLAFESRNPLSAPFPDWPTAAAPRRVTDHVAGQVDWWATEPERDGSRLCYELRYRFANSGAELVSANELVFRTQEEITHSLAGSGFSVVSIFGDWDRSPALPTSEEMIFVARRV